MKFVVLPGDGIGPEISAATTRVLEVLNRRLELGIAFETHEVGFASLAKEGTTFPEKVLDVARAADGIILGPVSHLDYPPREQGGINPSGHLRVQLDLYANIRPCRSREGIPHYGRTPMDLVIVRENTEGFYADRTMFMGTGEYMPTPDVAIAMRKVTSKGSRRIAKAGFELARTRPRRKVTYVHKANVLKISDALFLKECRAAAQDYPDIATDDQIIDSMTAMLVRDARRYDVIVTTNMFGDILSDLASELSGSLGLGGSINACDEHCMAQAQHGSAPDIQGQDKANPCSLVLSAAMLLDWIATRRNLPDFRRGAEAIDRAVDTWSRARRRGPATSAASSGPRRSRRSSAPRSSGASDVALKFCANLNFLFTDLPFLDRFEAAAKAGFEGVELLAPYEAPAKAIRERLDGAGLRQVLFNSPSGDRAGRRARHGLHPGPRERVPRQRAPRTRLRGGARLPARPPHGRGAAAGRVLRAGERALHAPSRLGGRAGARRGRASDDRGDQPGRVEDGRGSLGHAASPRFPSPLIKPDVRISRIRLSDWLHPEAHGGGPRCTRRRRSTPNPPKT